jgi:hypothetical protein
MELISSIIDNAIKVLVFAIVVESWLSRHRKPQTCKTETPKDPKTSSATKIERIKQTIFNLRLNAAMLLCSFILISWFIWFLDPSQPLTRRDAVLLLTVILVFVRANADLSP